MRLPTNDGAAETWTTSISYADNKVTSHSFRKNANEHVVQLVDDQWSVIGLNHPPVDCFDVPYLIRKNYDPSHTRPQDAERRRPSFDGRHF